MNGCGKQVRFIVSWQTYRVGDVIDPPAALRDWLVANGYVEDVREAESPGRPAKLTAKAAQKIAEGTKRLFG